MRKTERPVNFCSLTRERKPRSAVFFGASFLSVLLIGGAAGFNRTTCAGGFLTLRGRLLDSDTAFGFCSGLVVAASLYFTLFASSTAGRNDFCLAAIFLNADARDSNGDVVTDFWRVSVKTASDLEERLCEALSSVRVFNVWD